MLSLKYFIQKILGAFLDSPIIPEGKTTGYLLVKSERFDTMLGDNTHVAPPFFLHHVQLGNYSYISKNANISNCIIGKFCSIGPNFCCGLGVHPTNGISTSPMFYSTAKQNGVSLCKTNKVIESEITKIGNDVLIGANATVLDGVTIGDGAIIGAGAVVIDDIPPYAVAVGVPAKVVKFRFDEETVSRLLEKQWWDKEDDLEKVEQYFWNVNEYLSDSE